MKKLQFLALTMLLSTPVMLISSSGKVTAKANQVESSVNAKFAALSPADQAAMKSVQQASSDILSKSQALNESIKSGLQVVSSALAMSNISDAERSKLLNYQTHLNNLDANLTNNFLNKKVSLMYALPN